MTRVEDRFGYGTSYAYATTPGYESVQRLTSVTDPAGQVTTVTWVGNGDGTTSAVVSTPGGRASHFVRSDVTGDLVRIVDPGGGLASVFGYEEHGLRWSTDYRTGGTTYYAYDIYGAISSVAAPAIQTVDQGSVAAVTTFQSREAALLPPRWTNGVRVHPDSAWIRIRGPGGDSTRLLVNGEGNPTRVVTKDAQGKEQWSTTEYNSRGEPIATASSAGAGATYGWDRGLLVAKTDHVSGVSVVYDFNTLGQPITTAVEGVVRVKNVYSTDGRSVLELSIAGGKDTTRFTSDARGRVLTVRDPEGHLTSTTYQATSWQNTQSVTRGNKTLSVTYDGYGRPQTVTDPASRTTTTYYDALNRPTQVTAPDGRNSTWTYDHANRRYTFTDAKGQVYESTLNALGATTEARRPGSASPWRLYYDAAGNLARTVSPHGREVVSTYDEMKRPRTVTADGQTTTISYDTAGKWTAYQNAEGSDTIYVDGDGRVTAQVTRRAGLSQAYTLGYAYGARGNLQQIAMSAPGTSYARQIIVGDDSLGRANFVGNAAGDGTAILYNRDNLPSVIIRPRRPGTSIQLRTSLGYTSDHQPQSATLSNTSLAYAFDRYYGYDVLGRMNTMDAGVPSEDFVRRGAGYDLMGRLAWFQDDHTGTEYEWVCDNPMEPASCYQSPVLVTNTERAESYSYDAVGNRTDRLAEIQTGNRLTKFDGFTMTYDADGNLLTKVGNGVNQSFVWNALGQLVQVTTNGVTATYGYDGLGRRVRKTVGATTTYYLLTGNRIVMQQNGAGQPQLEFTYFTGVDNPHSVRRVSDGAVFYCMSEEPGHVTGLVNASHQLVNRYRYTPFGKTISASEQVAQPFRYTGREYDAESGLYYYRARYYDPALARFISEDPIGLVGGVNLYAYVSNDPLNFRDPSGFSECKADEVEVLVKDSDGNYQLACEKKSSSGGTMLPPIIITAPPPTNWYWAWGMLRNFVTGSGADHVNFGPGSSQVADMQNAYGVRQGRRLLCNKYRAGNPNPSVTNAGKGSFPNFPFFEGPRRAGSNATQQFVGSFTLNITGNGDGTATYRIHNVTSMTSASLHILPSWGRQAFFKVMDARTQHINLPFGNMSQTFQWTEDIAASCQ